MSKTRRLGIIAARKLFSYLLSLGPNFDPPHPPLPRGDFFQNRMVSSLRGKDSTKNEVDRFNILLDILVTVTHTDRQTDRQTNAK